jgi:hypothetical protein
MRQVLGADLSAFEIMWPEFYAFATQVRKLSPLTATDNFYLLVESEDNAENHHAFANSSQKMS